MGNFIFLQILAAVCALSIITTLFNKRILDFPQAIGVPIVSALLVFILQWSASLLNGNEFITINITSIQNAVRDIDLYDFLINGVICFILTASALTFKVSDLKNYWKPIGILASIALALCALFFASLMFGFQWLTGANIPFAVLLLLGAALGATDPIGIKGVLSSIKAPRHLMIKLEGESLFNDAVCIALFMTILHGLQGNGFSIVTTVEVLLYEIVVAGIIGWFFGQMTLRILSGKHEMESLILTTAFLACGSYLVALYAHASAPIACVVGGLIVGNRWHQILDEGEITYVNHFWHAIEGIINSFLFTLIGLELFILELNTSLILGGVVAFICLHLSRFLANFASFSLLSDVRKTSYNGSLTILSWGGVRGAISLALILSVSNVPELQPYSSFLVGYTFIVVLMSGVVCGLGLPAVMNAFYHNPNEPTTGFAGWYQRLVKRFNRKGYQYVLSEDEQGNEVITRYQPPPVVIQETPSSVGMALPLPKVIDKDGHDELAHPNGF